MPYIKKKYKQRVFKKKSTDDTTFMIAYFDVAVDLYDSYVKEVVSFKFSISLPSSNLQHII